MNNIYQNIGGKKTVESIVDNFYHIILKDKRVKHLFNYVNLEAQKSRTFIFLARLMGEKIIIEKNNRSNKYLVSEKLTEEQLLVFEETWKKVLVKMDLLILLPIFYQGVAISRCVKPVSLAAKA